MGLSGGVRGPLGIWTRLLMSRELESEWMGAEDDSEVVRIPSIISEDTEC